MVGFNICISCTSNRFEAVGDMDGNLFRMVLKYYFKLYIKITKLAVLKNIGILMNGENIFAYF